MRHLVEEYLKQEEYYETITAVQQIRMRTSCLFRTNFLERVHHIEEKTIPKQTELFGRKKSIVMQGLGARISLTIPIISVI